MDGGVLFFDNGRICFLLCRGIWKKGAGGGEEGIRAHAALRILFYLCREGNPRYFWHVGTFQGGCRCDGVYFGFDDELYQLVSD